ncbi:MAG: hypothetical protein ABJC26_07500 [Gemmatimonadaceae bacterium]
MKKLSGMNRKIGTLLMACAWWGFAAPSAIRAQSVAVPAKVSARQTDDSIADFGAVVASLSETGGDFDTDNLISNESSYLHVMGALDRYAVKGGAYIGVGPDQNFSYIARIHPRIAFLMDIRRDNMLQHLMFKSLFASARNRTEYLALWLGKPVPPGVDSWSAKSIDAIVAYMDETKTTDASANAARALVLTEVKKMGVALGADDYKTIARFHNEFISAGLQLRFTTVGRPPQWYYPTLKQLILEHDLEGKMASYLANEADFQYVKSMQRRNMMIPVVGDLGGTHALAAIGALMSRRGDKLSAIYPSNAEDYVMRDGNFGIYAKTLLALPRDSKSVIIRSFFGGGNHPEAVPGYYSTQLLQKVDAFAAGMAAGGYANYRVLVRSYLPLRSP